jgi:hypothetical protein
MKYFLIEINERAKIMRKKFAEKIDNILKNSNENENLYDALTSELVDNAAKQGRELNLERAFQQIIKQYEDLGYQYERLALIKKIMEEPLFLENKIKQSHRQKLIFGLIDEKDPKILKEYAFEILGFDPRDDEKSTLDKLSRNVISRVGFSTRAKCLIVMRERRLCGNTGYIYYFVGKELLGVVPFDSTFALSRLTAVQGCRESSAMRRRMKALTLKHCNSLELLHSPFTMLSRFSSQPNNPEILRYLLKLARQNHPDDINGIIKNCLHRAMENGCLSNVMALLKECDTHSNKKLNIQSVEFGALKIDLFSFFNNEKLNTASPFIDICLLCCKYGNKIKKQFDFAFDILEKNKDEKGCQFLQIKREIVALVLIDIFSKRNWDYSIDSKYFFNRLADSLHSALLGNQCLSVEFYRRNMGIFEESDIEKIKSLPYCRIFFQDKTNIDTIYNIFTIFKKRDCLPFWYDSINIEMVSLINAIVSRKEDKDPGVLDFVTNQVLNTVSSFLPPVISSKVMEYFLPSLFEKITVKMGILKSCLLDKNKKNTVSVCDIGVTRQEAGSSDCGYWALFHAFKFLSTVFSCSKVPVILCNSEASFLHFKILVRGILSNRNEDLTAVDLDRILRRAATGDEKKLVKVFPELHNQLSMMNDCVGIPCYTIINTLTTFDMLKLERSFTFCGYLPYLKMQIAVNFYVLSQQRDQPRLHFIFFGTQGHWHVQVLSISYNTPGSIIFYRIDSNPGVISAETLQQFNLHLQDLLDNPEEYAQNVAEEVIPPIHEDLIRFYKILQSSSEWIADQEEIIYKHCELLNNFFSTFGKLPFAKKYLPVLELAKKTARCCLKKNLLEFTNVFAELSRLGNLCGEEKNQTAGFFSSATPVTSRNSLPATFGI